jgi:hypothetical protein
LNGRCLAATVLAMLIRFATYIAVSSPNSSKASDQNAGSDHILLLSLIDLLRELPSSPSFIHETNSPRPTKVNMVIIYTRLCQWYPLILILWTCTS